MTAVWVLAASSVRENWRTRFYLLTAGFGAVFIFMSLVLGAMAVDQELRVLADFGLALIELVGVGGALFAASTSLLRELETKTIYLILTRPVGRGRYILGRYLGLLISAAVSMLAMAALHAAVLLAKGWTFEPAYAAALFGSLLKVAVVAALGLYLALASSSAPTALGIGAILWALGHFLPEIRALIQSSPAPKALVVLLEVLSRVVPDLQLLNARDRLTGPLAGAGPGPAVQVAYAAAYASVWLGLSRFWLARKEL